ncbi:HPr family phosphocarrier protein [Bacillus sp. V3-13]|uniref:HPr family phosphocarrier protein n=1 Tax=Bacillus sp. V3-13 TaxID=2053728 RepID=UPI000C77373B|nr:HPr family phosphocarrier protein [Bacillus sp. V3-13]PLR75919.1 HPr family phosphocarrier protein [Bacillus sp. V3-13]
MIEREITVTIDKGLHARPAADLVKKLNSFESKVDFFAGAKRFNPKSVLSMMTASIKQGQTIRVVADGNDEGEVIDWLTKFL